MAKFSILASCLRELNDSETEDNVSLRKEGRDSLEVSGVESFYLFATFVVEKSR